MVVLPDAGFGLCGIWLLAIVSVGVLTAGGFDCLWFCPARGFECWWYWLLVFFDCWYVWLLAVFAAGGFGCEWL